MSDPPDHLESRPLEPNYHPDFIDRRPGTDFTVTLVSRDKARFRVSANVLRSASSVFKTTLSLPQPQETSEEEPIIDFLDEEATTIEGLLRMITGAEFPRLDTIEAIEPLVLAADKWDMRGPLSIMRVLLLMNSSIVTAQPIRLYWLGCRLKWDDLAKLASKYSCIDDIYDRLDLQPLLTRLDPKDLLRLTKFHRNRRGLMKAFVEGGVLGPKLCYRGEKLVATPEFRDFEYRVLEDMDQMRPGQSLPEVEERLRSAFMATTLSSFHCPSCGARHSIDSVTQVMISHWATLPQTAQWELGLTPPPSIGD